MSRITKSITFNSEIDGELLAWIQTQMRQSTGQGMRPDFSRFVRGILYQAYTGQPKPSTTLPDNLLTDIRAVVEAAVSNALANISVVTLEHPEEEDDNDFSGLLLE